MGERLSAGEVCIREVVIAERDMLLSEAAQLLRGEHVGCLVVVEEFDGLKRVCGLLTDRDLVTSVIAPGLDVRALCVEDVMSTPPITLKEDDSLIDVMRTMRRHGVRRLPVVTEAEALVGLVTVDDVLQVLSEELGLLIGAIQGQMAQERHQRP